MKRGTAGRTGCPTSSPTPSWRRIQMSAARSEQSASAPGPAGPAPAAPRPHPVRGLLALAWRHKGTCVGVLVLQVALLVLGVGGLGVSGAAIDLVRRALDPS